MTDQRLRSLERSAAAGDESAKAALETELLRIGLCRKCRQPLDKAPPPRIHFLVPFLASIVEKSPGLCANCSSSALLGVLGGAVLGSMLPVLGLLPALPPSPPPEEP